LAEGFFFEGLLSLDIVMDSLGWIPLPVGLQFPLKRSCQSLFGHWQE
jgi:hypothetical protein